MLKNHKIYVAGHTGLVGSALVRELRQQGYENLVLRSRQELDLLDEHAVADFMATERPQFVFLAAAKVGGILANNTYPAHFLYDNLKISLNLIHHAYLNGVKKLLYLGSSCIYPKFAPQPICEEYLLKSELEPTNEAYALAKISGLRLCQSYNRQYGTDFIAAMPTNLYGIHDHFDLQSAHVLPALMRKVHEAKVRQEPTVTVWGSGTPRREFLYVDDLAQACLFLMSEPSRHEIINVGYGKDLTIRELAELIQDVVEYQGDLVYDREKPDGTPQKLLDVSKMNAMGWQAKTTLADGLRKTYNWYLNQQETLPARELLNTY